MSSLSTEKPKPYKSLSMKTKDIRVSLWAKSETSFCCLVDIHYNAEGKAVGASRSVWFPKKLCILVKIRPANEKLLPFYILTCPIWLLDKNKVKYEDEDYIVPSYEEGVKSEEL